MSKDFSLQLRRLLRLNSILIKVVECTPHLFSLTLYVIKDDLILLPLSETTNENIQFKLTDRKTTYFSYIGLLPKVLFVKFLLTLLVYLRCRDI